jgi:hypothetical protein
VTSRPELPIRLGFKNLSDGVYQDLILEQIPRPTIEQDIATYLRTSLSAIRKEHNVLYPRRQLAPDWPCDADIQALAHLAVPLFIFAATACRFVGDHRHDPPRRLQLFLSQITMHESRLDQIYCPILDTWFNARATQGNAKADFQNVVGSIVLLANPLSSVALARLLEIDEAHLEGVLIDLHSVLTVPPDGESPIELLHLSFRECLVDPQKEDCSPFWIDGKKTHEILAAKCLSSMSRALKEDLCGLKAPGTLRSDISNQLLNQNISADAQYACRYWVSHLKQSGGQLCDGDSVHSFLSKHFLHWFEALGLIGRIHEGTAMLVVLQTCLKVSSCICTISIFAELELARY